VFSATHTLEITGYSTASVSPGNGGGGSSSGSATGFWIRTFDLTENNTVEGINYSLAKRQRIKVKVKNEEHYVGVVSINGNSAVLNIASTPKNVTFSLAEEKKYDLDEDGNYDLFVKLKSINGDKANLNLREINEVAVVDEDDAADDEISDNSSGDGNIPKISFWIIIIFIIASIIVIFIYFYRLHKKSKRRRAIKVIKHKHHAIR